MFLTSNMSSTRRNNMYDRAKWQNATELGFVFHKILKSSSYSHRIPKTKTKKKENHIHRAFSQKYPLKTKSTVDHLVGETRPVTSFSHLRQHQNPTTTSPIKFFAPQDRGTRLCTKSPRVTTTSRSDQFTNIP